MNTEKKCTVEEVRQAIHECLGVRLATAQALGITIQTLRDYTSRRWPELKKDLKKADIARVRKTESSLFDIIDGGENVKDSDRIKASEIHLRYKGHLIGWVSIKKLAKEMMEKELAKMKLESANPQPKQENLLELLSPEIREAVINDLKKKKLDELKKK